MPVLRPPWGGGKNVLPSGFHGGRQGPHPLGESPKLERSLDAGKPLNDECPLHGERGASRGKAGRQL